MTRHSVGLIACLMLLGASATAEPTRRYELGWQAPIGCPRSAQVTQELDELLAGAAATAPAPPVVANATVTNVPGGHSLSLTLYDSTGAHSRQIDAPNCEELGHAAALVVALAVDPTILERRANQVARASQTSAGDGAGQATGHAASKTTHEAVAEPRAVAEQPAPATDERAQAPLQQAPISSPVATSAPLFWRAGLGTFGAFGTLPGQNIGLDLFAAIQRQLVRFEVAASAVQAQTSATTTPTYSASFAAYRAHAKLCGLVSRATWAVGPCIGSQVGVISGEGRGTSQTHRRSPPWLASSFGGMFELRISATSLLLLTAELEIPFRYDEFRLAGEQIFRTPKVSGSMGVGLAAGWH